MADCGLPTPLNRGLSYSEIVPGDYYTIKISGEDWPVVICDEKLLEKYLKITRQPELARQADGTWKQSVETGSESVQERCFPALVLGTLELRWASREKLETFHLDLGKAIRNSAVYSKLGRAWAEAIEHYDKSDLSYWESRLAPGGSTNGKKPVNGIEKKLRTKRKRKGTPTFKYPAGYFREEVDDEEGEGIFAQPSEMSEPNIKEECVDSSSSAEVDALYKNPVDPVRTKRNKLDILNRFSTQPSTPSATVGQPQLKSPIHLFEHRAVSRAASIRPIVKAEDKANFDPTKATLYIGQPHTKFVATRSSLAASPLLSSLLNYDARHGWYVMSPLLSSLDPQDFFPVGQYLERGEYDPHLLNEGTDFVRFEGDNFETDAQVRNNEVVHCGVIYAIAQLLKISGLQDLAFRKLEALVPYQPFAILCVVELVFEKSGKDLRQYLVEYLEAHFWELVVEEAQKVEEIFGQNEVLAKDVLVFLSGATVPIAEKKVKREEPGEEEDVKGVIQKEDFKDISCKLPGTDYPPPLMSPSPRATVPDDEKIGGSNPSTLNDKAKTTQSQYRAQGQGSYSRQEEEMIKMALQDADSEADFEKILEEQKSFFL